MASKREKKSWSSRKKKLWLVICLIIITSGLYAIFVYLNTRNTGTKFEYTLSDKSFGNPLMGYVPSAEEKTVSEDVHLVYVDITWKELEPKKGHYNWETIEESNQFKRWKKEGKLFPITLTVILLSPFWLAAKIWLAIRVRPKATVDDDRVLCFSCAVLTVSVLSRT